MKAEAAHTQRPVPSKSQQDLDREWDEAADLRYHQIETGEDVSYHEVLLPVIFELAGTLNNGPRIVDAGCGSGFLAARLAAHAARLVGVDPSRRQIELAVEHHGGPTVEYVNETLESFARGNASHEFDLVVANMTLMDVLDLDAFIEACSDQLRAGGALVFTVTHPWFWPKYWGYGDETWFEYGKEMLIEAPLRISLDPVSAGLTTHVHRPLSTYWQALRDAGFLVERLVEPTPNPETRHRYPDKWRFPRYLGGRCSLQRPP